MPTKHAFAIPAIIELLSEPQGTRVCLGIDPDAHEEGRWFVDSECMEYVAATPEAALILALRAEAESWEKGVHDGCIPIDEQTPEERATVVGYVERLRLAADMLESEVGS